MPSGPVRPFPRHSLREALVVAEALKSNNNGNPLSPILMAKALNVGASSSDFRDLLRSSERYGLTSGGQKDNFVSLGRLGLSIVAPTSEEGRRDALRRALLNVPFYDEFFKHYNGGKLPAQEFLANILEQQFHLPPAYVTEAIALIRENAQFVGIIETVGGSDYVILSRTPASPDDAGVNPQALTESPQPSVASMSVAQTEAPEPAGPAATSVIPLPLRADTPTQMENRTAATSGSSKIFIGHGKNHVPLGDLKRILEEFGVPYLVAEEEPNRARPISEKVAGIMRSCRSAILIFTKDEHFRTLDGQDVWRPSENVVHELGAASILYENRVVIFKEEGITLPSNFRDIGYIEFGQSGLAAKAVELIRELIGFGLIRVTAV